MTKQQEIEALQALITKLGTDSYTGPWLAEQMPYIEADIRADHPIGISALSLVEAKAEVARGYESARLIVESAREHAKRIRDEALAEAKQTRTTMLRQFAKELREMADRAEAGRV